MTPAEFLQKCIGSDKLKETIHRRGYSDSLWHCIDHCIWEIEQEGSDIDTAARYLQQWMADVEDHKTIDELLDYCSPEFCAALQDQPNG